MIKSFNGVIMKKIIILLCVCCILSACGLFMIEKPIPLQKINGAWWVETVYMESGVSTVSLVFRFALNDKSIDITVPIKHVNFLFHNHNVDPFISIEMFIGLDIEHDKIINKLKDKNKYVFINVHCTVEQWKSVNKK